MTSTATTIQLTSSTPTPTCPNPPPCDLPFNLQVEQLKLIQGQNELENQRKMHQLSILSSDQELQSKQQQHQIKVQSDLLKLQQMQFDADAEMGRKQLLLEKTHLAVKQDHFILLQQRQELEALKAQIATGLKSGNVNKQDQDEIGRILDSILITPPSSSSLTSSSSLPHSIPSTSSTTSTTLHASLSNHGTGIHTTHHVETMTHLAQIETQRHDLHAHESTLKSLREELETAQAQLKKDQDELKAERDRLESGQNQLKKDQQQLKIDQGSIIQAQNQLQLDRNALSQQQHHLSTERTAFYQERNQFQEERAQLALTISTQTPIDVIMSPLGDSDLTNPGLCALGTTTHRLSFSHQNQSFLIKGPMTHQQLIDSVINPALAWAPHYSSSSSSSSNSILSIVYHFPQLEKQIHANHEHFCDLLFILFLSPDSDYGWNCHWNQDRTTYASYQPLLDGVLKKTDGAIIPQLHSNPKLFFSSPYIANGDWVQFYGPGAILTNINTQFQHVTLGSLCDPKKKDGVFTSVNFAERASGKEATSKYKISIKWEETE